MKTIKKKPKESFGVVRNLEMKEKENNTNIEKKENNIWHKFVRNISQAKEEININKSKLIS